MYEQVMQTKMECTQQFESRIQLEKCKKDKTKELRPFVIGMLNDSPEAMSRDYVDTSGEVLPT